ncbi:MAG TPA: hypothetical protein VE308_05395, partial [Nitrososphaera sp.]|nr:hypothetical protein [Nitrososphaera sp.]
VGRGIANPQDYLLAASFQAYLKAQNKRNVKQIICHAKIIAVSGNRPIAVSSLCHIYRRELCNV